MKIIIAGFFCLLISIFSVNIRKQGIMKLNILDNRVVTALDKTIVKSNGGFSNVAQDSRKLITAEYASKVIKVKFKDQKLKFN
jgi:hypothetical protein